MGSHEKSGGPPDTERGPFTRTDVQRYYDKHTSAFLSFGEGRALGVIHRAVWGPGVTTREAALHYVDEQIAERLRAMQGSTGPLHVLDLGCGVGASLQYLATRLPIRGTGITVSPVQAAVATRRFRETGWADRLICIEADYLDPPPLPAVDLAYAIESFVHGASPARFFETCRRLLRPGGVLIICDDVKPPTSDPRAPNVIERFRRGWHINTLVDSSELPQMAAAAGFVHESTHDLSSFLALRRPRDRAIRALVAMMARVPPLASRFDHWRGGDALQQCLEHGWITYQLATFRRAGEDDVTGAE